MGVEITENYDDMIGLLLLVYMCKVEKTHLDDRVEIRGVMCLRNSCRHT